MNQTFLVVIILRRVLRRGWRSRSKGNQYERVKEMHNSGCYIVRGNEEKRENVRVHVAKLYDERKGKEEKKGG
jgi:hypothetical protein